MINAVIVTVKMEGSRRKHDMELPADIPLSELASKLLMALKKIEKSLFMGVGNIKIMYNTENRYLFNLETLASAGVWDGSIITVERVM